MIEDMHTRLADTICRSFPSLSHAAVATLSREQSGCTNNDAMIAIIRGVLVMLTAATEPK